MPRIQPVTLETARGETKTTLEAVKGKFGMVPNLVEIIAASPAALQAYVAIGGALDNGVFDAPTREAIALTVAGANGCDYCASAHSAASKGLKVADDEIEARLGGRSSDDALNSLLSFARSVVETRGFVSDDELHAVRNAGYSDEEIAETVALVVANIFTNYFNHVAETEIDFPVVDASAYKTAA
ncbi:MAG: carboxymuconolactone decarboxylase family protein [Pseudomonadota bacterium]